MRRVIIIHGWDGSPREPMLLWFRSSLEARGYSVVVPEMPEADAPKVGVWLQKMKDTITLGEKVILVGHSVGCQAVLRYLETLPEGTSVLGIVLIAPWMKLNKTTIEEEGEEVVEVARPWMETPIDFAKVKARAGKVTAIFSDDDPYVPTSQKSLFEKELGAKTILEHNKGHFTEDDNISELPSALEAILEIDKN